MRKTKFEKYYEEIDKSGTLDGLKKYLVELVENSIAVGKLESKVVTLKTRPLSDNAAVEINVVFQIPISNSVAQLVVAFNQYRIVHNQLMIKYGFDKLT